jgi:peptidoglycan/xylan/chitin deacetylase (PgdA/CDA1 family)
MSVASADDMVTTPSDAAAPAATAEPQPQQQPTASAPQKRKQLLMISFDGAGPNPLWKKSMDIAARSNAHFTYFLACSLIIDRARAKTYQGPGEKPGHSNIGFAQTADEARERLGHIWEAHLAGHEIGSHTCGHFDGKDWSEAEWLSELKTFRTTVSNAWADEGAAAKEPAGWKDFVMHDIRGFRAPYFSTSAGMIAAEKKAGFVYDASAVTKGPAYPDMVSVSGTGAEKGDNKDADGMMLRFGLPLIPEGPSARPIIGMDYNLYFRHSKATEDVANAASYEDRAYKAFKAAFDRQYDGKRVPLQLGFHFVEMNGGAYWRAMETLVTDVCLRDDVSCVSYSQAIEIMKKEGTITGPQGRRSGL